jgi:putative oxidoreductase
MSPKNKDAGSSPYAIWLLRLALAIALLTHVELNLGGLDPAMARQLGLPLGVPRFALLLESVVAFALIFGIWPRILAMGGAAVVLGVIFEVRGPTIFTDPSFHWAGPALWIGALILLSLLGDGAFALLPTEESQQ